MSNKFEELLDLLVNEEMDKANELFHEIVVEKSREIYENMIAEEAEEEVDESSDEDEDDAVEEAMDDDEDDMEESIEEETTLEIGGDATDDMMGDIEDPEAMGGEDDMEMGGDMAGDMGAEDEGSEEERIADLEDALEELKAEFEQLMAGEKEEPEHDDMEMGDEEGEEETEEESFAPEQVREYVEKVSDGHGVEKKGRADTPDNGKSPVSSAKGKPTTGATAHNILGSKSTEAGGKGGQGLVGNTKGEYTDGGTHNVNGVKSGIKTLSKVAAGHGAEKKGTGETGAYTKSPADRMQ